MAGAGVACIGRAAACGGSGWAWFGGHFSWGWWDVVEAPEAYFVGVFEFVLVVVVDYVGKGTDVNVVGWSEAVVVDPIVDGAVWEVGTFWPRCALDRVGGDDAVSGGVEAQPEFPALEMLPAGRVIMRNPVDSRIIFDKSVIRLGAPGETHSLHCNLHDRRRH